MEQVEILFHSEATFADPTENERVVTGIEVFKTGVFRPGNWDGKKLKVDKKFLKEMISNYTLLKDKKIIVNIPHRLDHSWSVKDIAGYVTNLYLNKSGDRVLADVDFTNDDAWDMFKAKTIRNRSSEIGTYTDNEGNDYYPVFKGFAWVDFPAVEKLADVAASAFREGQEVAWVDDDGEKPSSDLAAALSNLSAVLDNGIGEGDSKAKALEALGACANALGVEIKTDKPQEVITMEKFDLSKVAKFTLHDGTEVTDSSLVELPQPNVITLSHGAGEIHFADQASADIAKAELAKLGEYEQRAIDAELAQRSDYVDMLKKGGKILGSEDALTAEKAFVATMSNEQYEAYKARMDAQPPLIKLNAGEGSQEGNPTPDAELEAMEATLKFMRGSGADKDSIDRLEKKIADHKAASEQS